MDTKPPIPATRSAWAQFGCFVANMLPQIRQNSRAIAFIRGHLMPGVVPQQATEVKKDVEVQSKGKCYFFFIFIIQSNLVIRDAKNRIKAA